MAKDVPRRLDEARDEDMPDGMTARHGEGDIEEAFVEVLPDFEPVDIPDEVGGAPSDMIEDRRMLDDLDDDHARFVDELEAMAVEGQERADETAVRRQERADDDGAAFLDRFDAGLPSGFGGGR